MNIRFPKSIWWIRSDLRLEDNPALSAATRESDVVIPVFISESNLQKTRSKPQEQFQLSALADLKARLNEIGSNLLIKQGDPAYELAKIGCAQNPIPVFANEGYSGQSKKAEQRVRERMDLKLFTGQLSIGPLDISAKSGEPFKVYSAFNKAWEKAYRSKKHETDLRRLATRNSTEGFNNYPTNKDVAAKGFSRSQGVRILKEFSRIDAGINRYSKFHDRVDLQSTSGLSAYIALGLIGPNEILETTDYLQHSTTDEEFRTSVSNWRNQIIWREFFKHSLSHFPQTENQSLNKTLQNIEWINQQSDIEAWHKGETGYPIVDAAMRQLSEKGWIHNRLRLIVASFLVKDLLVDWRIGANWFHEHLIDYDSALNSGNWQWTAGTGYDPAPFFRVFNPVLQGKKFDPHGNYVRQWVPEIKRLPNKVIHAPWESALPPKNYPAPIVDHASARKRALSTYRNSKLNDDGK